MRCLPPRCPITLCGVLAMVAALMVPAGGAAADVGEGSLVFAGTASLPIFPCQPPPTGESPCVGTFTASTFGRMTGMHGSSPWQVSIQALTSGRFAYTDLVPGVPCMEGVAAGTASLDTVADGQAFGTYHAAVVPRAVRNATVSYRFTWVRRGAIAILDVRDVTIRLEVDELGWLTVREDGEAAAVAAFLAHVDAEHPPTGCTGGPATPLQGSFLGNVTGITAPN